MSRYRPFMDQYPSVIVYTADDPVISYHTPHSHRLIEIYWKISLKWLHIDLLVGVLCEIPVETTGKVSSSQGLGQVHDKLTDRVYHLSKVGACRQKLLYNKWIDLTWAVKLSVNFQIRLVVAAIHLSIFLMTKMVTFSEMACFKLGIHIHACITIWPMHCTPW
jgi:hypothetical protein